MKTPNGHLTYCSNIHTGEDWQHHFSVLQNSIPVIKQQVSPNIRWELAYVWQIRRVLI
jgi:hypothetical protein